MVNEGIIPGSLTEHPHLVYDEIQVKEEAFNFFHREDGLSPLLEPPTMKEEFEEMNTGQNAEEESDEETIATFITAAGQQLALYAVEDSDEIFAVAVYDESGEPPTDFQFLMKSDVEKLIGEGAVRTVKKTSQFKKQIYEANEVTCDNEELTQGQEEDLPNEHFMTPHSSPMKAEGGTDVSEGESPMKSPIMSPVESPVMSPMKSPVMSSMKSPVMSPMKSPVIPHTKSPVTSPMKSPMRSRVMSPVKTPVKSPIRSPIRRNLEFQSPEHAQVYDNWVPENVFVVMQDSEEDESDGKENEETKWSNQIVEMDMNEELVQKSTVQYILSDDPPDSSDLTLDDIEGLLGPSPASPKQTTPQKCLIKVETSLPEDVGSCRVDVPETNASELPEPAPPEKPPPVDEDTPVSAPPTPQVLRIKRPRKQQLTTVNRADSEIIIQPAMLVEEDAVYENGWRGPKKRGRRKKNETGAKRTYSKRPGRPGRKSRIEIIDIDVEDGSREIITIDGKEKGSSDKENEVIMVGDSEDEDGDDDEPIEVDDSDDSDYDLGAERKSRRLGATRSSRRHLGDIFKCLDCAKQFRQERALDAHSRVCPESRKTRTSSRTTRSRTSGVEKSDRPKSQNKKQYQCKNCEERFDVVVALARHARLVHSKKKAHNSESDGNKEEEEEKEEPVVKRTRSFLEKKVKDTKTELSNRRGKKIKRRMWNGRTTRKVNCGDCGRWFSSLALLLAHSLQHATKKIVSEKSKVQRCRRCKKVFRSRFLYIRHLRVHSSSKPRKRIPSVIKSAAGKKIPQKSRGRARKL